jgi:hypothetical protein
MVVLPQKKMRILPGVTLVCTAATVLLDVPLVILLLKRDNYEVPFYSALRHMALRIFN